MDKLEAFASFHGPDFYGLPRNTHTVSIVKEKWTVPSSILLPDGNWIVPFWAGKELDWKVESSDFF